MSNNKMFPVGEYTQLFNDATGQTLPLGPIYQSYGLRAHIEKRHPEEIDNLDYVEDVIRNPDYIGKNPKEPESIELVKILQGNVMVCIKLDRDEQYFFVASVFSISQGKLSNRINSGRLRAIDKSSQI